MWNPKMPLVTAAARDDIAEMLVRADRRRLGGEWIGSVRQELIDRGEDVAARDRYAS